MSCINYEQCVAMMGLGSHEGRCGGAVVVVAGLLPDHSWADGECMAEQQLERECDCNWESAEWTGIRRDEGSDR